MVDRSPDLPPVDGMDADWSGVITSQVQDLCENLKKRDFETAVFVLDNGNGEIQTYGSPVGAAFFLSKPDLATMFQDFCAVYIRNPESIDIDVICETVGNKHRGCEISGNTDRLQDVDSEDCMNTVVDNERECDGKSSGEESDVNNREQREDTYVESKRITRQTKKKSMSVSLAPKARKKKKKGTRFKEKPCLQESSDASQIVNQSAEKKIVKSIKESGEINDQIAFKCSECNKPFKSQAGLTAHMSYIHLKAKNGGTFSLPEYTPRNLQLHYIGKDGNETSGLRSSMYEKQIINDDVKFFCKICSYSTDQYNVVVEHTQTHVIKDLLACSLCHKTFQAKKSLWRHTNQHKKFPHMCKICLRMYETKDELKEHEVTHKPFHMCSVCNKTYESVGRLNYHIKTSHGPKQNTCEICGSSFTNKSLLRQHKKRHGPKQFFCDKCSCSYYFMHQLTNHLKIHDENSLKYKCNVCSKEYVNKSHWKEHMKLHDGSNFVQCDQCGKSYNSRKSLNLHKNCKHVDERRFICQVCGKAFMTKHHLKNHLISHDDKRDYKCRFCDATFKKNDVLKMHENVHTREQKFMCDICGEHFLRRSSLRNHRLTHFPGHQRWKCRYCEDKFRTQSAMLTHIKNKHADIDLTHDRPLCKRCEQCGKVFAKGLTFRIHMDMHAGIKRHKCRTCGNAFTDPANLRVHQKIHDGTSKQYICEKCDSRFSSVKQYTIHMQKHGKSETQVVQQSGGNVGLNLTVMQVKSVEERNEAHDTLLRDRTSHADTLVTMSAVGTINQSQEQMNTNHRPANICQDLTTNSGFKDNTNNQATISCVEMMNTNTDVIDSSNRMVIGDLGDTQLRPTDALNYSVGGSLRQEMDINQSVGGSLRPGMDINQSVGGSLRQGMDINQSVGGSLRQGMDINQSVGGSLRQGMDIKNYDHIQLYYSAMF